MKTAFEQLSEAAEEKEYSFTSAEVAFIIEAMQIYAQSAIDEIKEKIAEEATIECVDWDSFIVDKESIRSVTIELK